MLKYDIKMSRLNIVGLICRCVCLLIFFNPNFIWSVLKLHDFKIENYYLGSSRIYKTDHGSRLKKRDVPVSTRPEFLFDVQLYNDGKPLTVYIKQRDSDVLAEKAVFLKIFNASDFGPISLDSHLYEGYITNYPDNSSVNGYVKNSHFYGHLIINNTMYYIDELRGSEISGTLDLPGGTFVGKNALIFKRDSVIIGMFLNETKLAKDLFQVLIKQNYYHRKFQIWKQNGKLCSMVIVIDNSFLTLVHNSNVQAAIFQILFSLEEANSVFRSTDFDGDGTPDNIGFYVKKVVVMATPGRTDFIPEYHSHIIKVSDYLVAFSRYKELAKHCLGIVFTAQKFDMRTLGASFAPDSTSLFPTSGICDEYIPNLGMLNGLVITTSTIQTPLVNQIIFEVTITHELGHSFGASHDEGPQCFGYVMSPTSFSDYHINRMRVVFSPCSRDHILRTLVMKGGCMEPIQTSFCGNGIVEEGEDCDCGLTRDCLEKDPCCVPRRTKEHPCKINRKRGFHCHPSQGQCCTSDCRYSTHLEKFVNCKHFDHTCPCADNKTTCTCGLNGMCIQNECHSAECARLGLRECHCQNNKTCQVCCQYENTCVAAVEATNKALSSKQKYDLLKKIMLLEPEESIHKTKQFENKMFCVEDRCISLTFIRSGIGDYCLRKGKLGKCEPNLQCQIFKTRQSFPSFESASGKFRQDFVHMICYLILNGFLIYAF